MNEDFAETVLGAIGSALVVRRGRDDLIVWNGAAERLLGWRTPDALGRGFLDLEMPSLDSLANDVETSRSTVGAVEREVLLRCKDGHSVSVLAQATRLDSDAGGGVVIVLSDVTQRRRTEQHLKVLQEQAALLLQHSADVMTLVDLAGRITFVSAAIADSTQHEVRELVGGSFFGFLHPDDRADARDALSAAALDYSGEAALTVRFRRKGGDYIWLEGRAVNLLHETSVGAILVALHDITQRVEAESELAHRATHDPLTALPNRALFQDRLNQHLEHARRHGSAVAVLFWDVDGFKRINDSAGHAVGDRILVEMARRAAVVMRAEDTVARLGGDEFVACAEVESRAHVTVLAERLLEALHIELTLVGGVQATVTASIGVAYGASDDVETMLAEADKAMYEAKRRGGGAIHVIAVPPARSASAEPRRDGNGPTELGAGRPPVGPQTEHVGG